MTLAPIPNPPATPSTGTPGAQPAAAPTPAGHAQAGGQPPVAAAPSPSTVPKADAPAATPAAPAAAPAATPDADAAFLEGQPDSLKELYAKLPPEIRAANNKAYSERMMKHADRVKLADTIIANPREAAIALAQKAGLKLQPEPTPAAVAAKSLTEELTPFFEGNTQAAAAFEGLLTKVIEAKLQPMQETHERATQQALLSEAQASEARFLAKHPDAKQHEAAIGEYMTKVQPGAGVSDDEFLEMAYSWATRDARSAASVMETVERLADGNAATAGSGRGADGAPIATAPPQDLPTTTQAVAAALRGERWER